MFRSTLRKLKIALQIATALLLLAAAQALGVTATASGTYTWNPATGVINWNWISTDFSCDGPIRGPDIQTEVTVTATSLNLGSSGDVFSRANGTAGDIVGTWTATDSATGSSFTVTFDAAGTVTVVGNIVHCTPGSENPHAVPAHFANGYYVELAYEDSPKSATAVSVTGPGITGSRALTYSAQSGSWNSWTLPGSNPFLGTTYPAGLPFTYTFTVTEPAGARTTTSTVDCFQVPFATNLSPTGAVAGTPVFSWSGLTETGVRYGVELDDSNNNRIWNYTDTAASTVAYGGPALTPGMNYSYNVLISRSAACPHGLSLARASFTYAGSVPDTSPPTVPAGVNATAAGPRQVNLSWAASTDNVGVTAYKIHRTVYNNCVPASGTACAAWYSATELLATLAGTPPATGYVDASVSPATRYDYALQACDAAGNCSAQSAVATIRTPADPATPLPAPPMTQAVFTAPTGRMPAEAVQVSAAGTFGKATLLVTLDLSRVLTLGSLTGLGQFAAGYNIYVAALAPGGVMGLPAATWFVLPQSHSWAPLSSPIAPYLAGIAANATNSVQIAVLEGLDISMLVGTEIYVGYGTDDQEMLNAGRYRGIYKVQ